MKKKLKDDNNFPLNFNPSNYYQSPEQFIPLSQLSFIYPNHYLVSSWGRIYNINTYKYNTYIIKILPRNVSTTYLSKLKSIISGFIFSNEKEAFSQSHNDFKLLSLITCHIFHKHN